MYSNVWIKLFLHFNFFNKLKSIGVSVAGIKFRILLKPISACFGIKIKKKKHKQPKAKSPIERKRKLKAKIKKKTRTRML